MAKLKYANKLDDENIAKAILRDAAISTKHSIEICSKIRNKKLEQAKKILEKIISLEQAIKYTRFTEGAGHKVGIGPAKFPVKAAQEILKIIKSAESNALDKGLSKNLKIAHISANQASRPWHYGRQRRIKMKRTHVEVVLNEVKEKNKTEIKSETKVSEPQKQLEKTEVKEIKSKPKKKETKVKEKKEDKK
ncbi:MAG: 50S ribosomal protein L22 [archaeon]